MRLRALGVLVFALLVSGLVDLDVIRLVETRQRAFTALFNGTDLTGWVVENSDGSNFAASDGVVRVSGPNGWLRSARQYGDFTLRVEFRFLTDDADTGVFVRAPGPASNIFIRGWPANAYQVQLRNMVTNQTDNPLWIGHVYRHRVAPGDTSYDREGARRTFRPTGEWQTAEIDVLNDVITVQLNGVRTTTAFGIVNPRGFIGLQGETGRVEFRRIEIRD